MRLNKNLGLVLLGLWLIVTALIELGILRAGAISGLGTILAIVMLAAGILLLVGR